MSEQIYKIEYGTAVHLVLAKNPAEAERHVFRPRTTRLNAVQAREAEKLYTLEIAGEVAPLNQPQLPLGEQP